jgi:hypothetical protein|tara:strand:+ start:364 stop:882 length:519 start_codon:yes stop_codon:yes gene_type:complete
MEYYFSFLQSLSNIIENESKYIYQSEFIPADLKQVMDNAVSELIPVFNARIAEIGEGDWNIENLIIKNVLSTKNRYHNINHEEISHEDINPEEILLSSGLAGEQKKMKLLAFSKALDDYKQCKTALNLFLVMDIGKTLYSSLSNILFDSKYKTLLDECFNIFTDIYKKYVSL